jgi:hypothetical protein
VSTAGAGYLDAIFGGLRAAGRDLSVSQQWLDRAAKTKDAGWRAVFVREAQMRWQAASRALSEAEAGLGTSGVTRGGDGLTPVEQLQANLATMRANIDQHERKLASALLELAAGGRRGIA